MVLIVTDICYVSVYSYNFTYVVIHITIYIIHFWVKNIFSKKFDCQSTIYFILKSSSSFIKIQDTVLHMYNCPKAIGKDKCHYDKTLIKI